MLAGQTVRVEEMTKRVTLWAKLRNDTRSIFVAPGDWQMIIMCHAHLLGGGDDRWSEKHGTRLCREEEARALSDSLQSRNGLHFSGDLRVYLDFGDGRRGSTLERADDGLTPDQRKGELIRFLREGKFKWRYVSRPRRED